MPGIPTPEDVELVAQEAEEQHGQGLMSGAIPNLGDAVEVAVETIAEPVVDVAVEAGGTLLEGAVEVVGDVIGSVLGSLLE